MSESGKCPRALSARLLGYVSEPTPEWLETAAKEGTKHEDWIVEELIAEGITVTDRQKELLLEFENLILTGHVDGIVCTNDNQKLLEIKTMSAFEFNRWMKTGFDGFPQYLAQITCYLEATQLPECLYIVKNRSSGYIDRRVIKPMEGYIDEIISRLTEVAGSVAGGKLFPAEFDIMSIECRRCEYKNLCIPEPTELDKATKEQLDKAVEDIRLGNRLIAEGKEFYDRGKEILKNHTKASNLRKWKHNNLAILLVNVKENVTYPKEALLAKYGEQGLADIAKVKEAYDYLRLDDLDEKEA